MQVAFFFACFALIAAELVSLAYGGLIGCFGYLTVQSLLFDLMDSYKEKKI